MARPSAPSYPRGAAKALVAAALALHSLALAADTPRLGSFAFNNSADQFAILDSPPTTGQAAYATWVSTATGEVLIARGLADGRVEVARTAGAAAPITYTICVNSIGLDYDTGDSAHPALADLDGDGAPELIVGDALGTVEVKRLTFPTPALPTAEDIAPPLGNAFTVIDLNQVCQPAFADMDADGDLDFITANEAGEVLGLRNDGSATNFSPVTAAITWAGIPSAPAVPPYRAAFADLDGDGDVDGILCDGNGNLSRIRSDQSTAASGNIPLTINGSNFRTIPGGATVATGDLDGDGLDDLIVGTSTGGVQLLENAGTGVSSASSFTIQGNNVAPAGPITAAGALMGPSMMDIDGDDDADLFFGTGNGSVGFSRNEGITVTDFNSFTLATVEDPFTISDARIAVGDVFGDGTPGMLIGGADGSLRLRPFTVDATGGFTIQALGSALGADPFTATGFGANAAPALADLDGDGDLDVVVASSTMDLRDGITVIRNEGEASLARGGVITYTITMLTDAPASTPLIAEEIDFYDFDDDGAPDLIARVAGQSNPLYGQNKGSGASALFQQSSRVPYTITNISDSHAAPFFDQRTKTPKVLIVLTDGNANVADRTGITFGVPTGDSATTVQVGASSSVTFNFDDLDQDCDMFAGVGETAEATDPPAGTLVSNFYDIRNLDGATFSDASLMFSYDPAGSPPGAVTQVAQVDGSTTTLHPDAATGTTVSSVGNRVTVSGIDGFSLWYLIIGDPAAAGGAWSQYE